MTNAFGRVVKSTATWGILIAVVALGMYFPAKAGGPSTSIETEYLMTLHALIAPALAIDGPKPIDGNLYIGTVVSGSVEGPRIKGKIIGPSGDWYRLMPGGILRLDARLTIQTEDGELIFMSFNGKFQCSGEQWQRLLAGEEIKAGDCYVIIAPTFETGSEKYRWINTIQAVGKLVSAKTNEYLHEDIFAVK